MKSHKIRPRILCAGLLGAGALALVVIVAARPTLVIAQTQTNPPIGGLDSDGDGMPDAWETLYGTNPFVNDANLDPDQDGATNLQEYLSGRNPNHRGDAKLLAAGQSLILRIPEQTFVGVNTTSWSVTTGLQPY